MELPKLKNPKAKLMMEEAMRLAREALEVEEGRQRCAFCQLEVSGGILVEHYTSHYSLEQPGLLVKVLVDKNSKANLRCPLATCDNQEMEAVELDLHIAVQHHGILKAVLEEDARLPEKKVINSLFPSEEKVHDVWDFSGRLGPKEVVKVEPEIEMEENGKGNLEAESKGHREDGEIEDDDSDGTYESESTNESLVQSLVKCNDDLERMFHGAKTDDKVHAINENQEAEKEIEIKEQKPKRRRVQKESPSDWSEKRRQKEELIKEALTQIATGVPSRVVARQFGLSRNFLAKRVKQQDTSGWVRATYGAQSRVMSKLEESKFAESLRKQFNNLGQLLEWQTLKSLLQRHLQNLVTANPSRLTGFEATDQVPHRAYLRRFVWCKLNIRSSYMI